MLVVFVSRDDSCRCNNDASSNCVDEVGFALALRFLPSCRKVFFCVCVRQFVLLISFSAILNKYFVSEFLSCLCDSSSVLYLWEEASNGLILL